MRKEDFLMNLSLPKELEKLREEIEATKRPIISIKASPKQTTLFQSKFAGLPYLPKNVDYPKDENGSYMKLLAQINFAELPSVLDDFPKSGILQFFLSKDDDVMGLDFDDQTKQSNFKVLYYPEVLSQEEIMTDFSELLLNDNDEYFPVAKELRLSFELNDEVVSVCDYAFDDAFGDRVDFDEILGQDDDGYEMTLLDLYAENLTNEGHKMSGYAFFTQSDPREEKRYREHEVLLLQIDTDDENDIMWGIVTNTIV